MNFAQAMDYLMSLPRLAGGEDFEARAVPYVLALYDLALEMLGMETI